MNLSQHGFPRVTQEEETLKDTSGFDRKAHWKGEGIQSKNPKNSLFLHLIYFILALGPHIILYSGLIPDCTLGSLLVEFSGCIWGTRDGT